MYNKIVYSLTGLKIYPESGYITSMDMKDCKMIVPLNLSDYGYLGFTEDTKYINKLSGDGCVILTFNDTFDIKNLKVLYYSNILYDITNLSDTKAWYIYFNCVLKGQDKIYEIDIIDKPDRLKQVILKQITKGYARFVSCDTEILGEVHNELFDRLYQLNIDDIVLNKEFPIGVFSYIQYINYGLYNTTVASFKEKAILKYPGNKLKQQEYLDELLRLEANYTDIHDFALKLVFDSDFPDKEEKLELFLRNTNLPLYIIHIIMYCYHARVRISILEDLCTKYSTYLRRLNYV